jgi:signal transduction histidine kinase
VKRVGFRTRLFIILALFALIPSLVLTLIYGRTLASTLLTVSGVRAWERVGETGRQVVAIARGGSLTPAERALVEAHEQELNESLTRWAQFRQLAAEAPPVIAFVAVLGLLFIAIVASRVAGHLSRQLGRPLQELVGWTERIARGEPLPAGPPRRGAPEFEMLRQRMRRMAREIAQGRARELEAERLRAFRETARQVAHELKNPLTPIRFAVERLKRDVPPELRETVEVLAIESSRLEAMARSFSQFGRLPEGPPSEIEVGELARYSATATVPPNVSLSVDVEDGLPMIRGHHDALARALSNVLINAVDACRTGGSISVKVGRAVVASGEAVEIIVRDTGCGIPEEHLERIWEPYVTHKPGGTGLGLAIARQTILAHQGEVAATSKVGSGTEIRFVLPVSGAPAQPPSEAAIA